MKKRWQTPDEALGWLVRQQGSFHDHKGITCIPSLRKLACLDFLRQSHQVILNAESIGQHKVYKEGGLR